MPEVLKRIPHSMEPEAVNPRFHDAVGGLRFAGRGAVAVSDFYAGKPPENFPGDGGSDGSQQAGGPGDGHGAAGAGTDAQRGRADLSFEDLTQSPFHQESGFLYRYCSGEGAAAPPAGCLRGNCRPIL